MGKAVFPETSMQVYWAESTNYFMINQIKPPDVLVFKIYKLTASDKRLCHKSCDGECDTPFRVCQNRGVIYLSLFVSTLVLAVVIYLSFVIVKWIVIKSNNNDIKDEEGNLYEMTSNGDVKPKRHTISLSDDQTLNI